MARMRKCPSVYLFFCSLSIYLKQKLNTLTEYIPTKKLKNFALKTILQNFALNEIFQKKNSKQKNFELKII